MRDGLEASVSLKLAWEAHVLPKKGPHEQVRGALEGH